MGAAFKALRANASRAVLQRALDATVLARAVLRRTERVATVGVLRAAWARWQAACDGAASQQVLRRTLSSRLRKVSRVMHANRRRSASKAALQVTMLAWRAYAKSHHRIHRVRHALHSSYAGLLATARSSGSVLARRDACFFVRRQVSAWSVIGDAPLPLTLAYDIPVSLSNSNGTRPQASADESERQVPGKVRYVALLCLVFCHESHTNAMVRAVSLAPGSLLSA